MPSVAFLHHFEFILPCCKNTTTGRFALPIIEVMVKQQGKAKTPNLNSRNSIMKKAIAAMPKVFPKAKTVGSLCNDYARFDLDGMDVQSVFSALLSNYAKFGLAICDANTDYRKGKLVKVEILPEDSRGLTIYIYKPHNARKTCIEFQSDKPIAQKPKRQPKDIDAQMDDFLAGRI